MNRIVLILTFLMAIAVCFWLLDGHSEQNVDQAPSRQHTLASRSKVAPNSKAADLNPSSAKIEADKTREILEIQLFASPAIQDFLNHWKIEEKTSVKYISAKRGAGKQVIVLIPMISSKRKDELMDAVSKLLAVTFERLTKSESDIMRTALSTWFEFGLSDRVVQVESYNNAENLSGRWFEVEDASNIIDEFQYVDYGKINAHGHLSPDRLSDRYGHLFTIKEESDAE